MTVRYLIAAALLCGTAAAAQEIVKVPAKDANVSRPDDMFALPAGQWYVSKLISAGSEPCTETACEAGYTSGDLVISVEHGGSHTMVITGFRNCESVGFNEVATGNSPNKAVRSEVWTLVRKAVKATAKTCNVKAPDVAKLDVVRLYPAKAN